MPQLWRRRRFDQKHQGGDVTIADSADARLPVVRLSKCRSTRPAMLPQNETVPDSWEECDELSDPSGDQEGPLLTVSERRPQRSSAGRRYPPELWYLIGRHVAPEAVGTFAAICRDAYRATLTHQFWMRLYRCHCAPPPPLAQLVEPEWLRERRGCRAAVIRALHRHHGPLVARARRRTTDSADTGGLVGATCCMLGRCRSGGDAWLYCFMFRRPLNHHHRHLAPVGHKDVSTARQQLFHNDDGGVAGLLVRAPGTSQLPPVFGYVLHSCTATMTTGLHMKLTMVFSQSSYKESGARTPVPAPYLSRTLVLSPVKSYRLVHWWDDEFQDIFYKHMFSGKQTPS